MTRSGRPFVSSISIGGLTLCIGLAASMATAGSPRPAFDAPQAEQVEYWHARGEQARAEVAAARKRLDDANAAVRRMQRRNHPRGAARIALREEQAAARKAHAAAVRVLEVELPAEAQDAGASLHWLQAGN